MIRIVIALLFLSQVAAAQVNVRLVTDEAEAVLSILAKKKANEAITESPEQLALWSNPL